jgi:hypothetical protein
MALMRSGWVGGFLLGVLFNAVAMFVLWNVGQNTSITGTLMETLWRRNLNEASDYEEEVEEVCNVLWCRAQTLFPRGIETLTRPCASHFLLMVDSF